MTNAIKPPTRRLFVSAEQNPATPAALVFARKVNALPKVVEAAPTPRAVANPVQGC